ncbi:MAG: peptidoglycan DD-metalloendopeptidase family protein [Clostridiales bacterium]|jgi:murein DD-endopeptidase MepM/ murein hydrolase activator NlpD|nr:peptidoglycan DD-metalloendopeptidase family protein [Clostridiales bacterium]
MKKKWFIRIVAIILAAIMAASVIYVVVDSLTAGAVTQSEIDRLKKQQKEIQKKQQELQSTINSLDYERKTALAKKQVLDEQIELTQEDIDNTIQQIETYETLIAAKKQEVIEAQRIEDEQWALFKLRMREMEEYGRISYISVIFDATSFSDLLARINDVGEIMEYDQRLYEQLKASKQATIEAKESLELALKEQEEEKAKLLIKNQELEAQRAAADALLNEIEKNIDEAKKLYQEELEAGKKIQDLINKKTEQLKQMQVKGTGSFIWPTPSSNRVTSRFGNRKHPIFKDYRMHTGIDIGASYGASVMAADGGVIIISEYSPSYGHYIVISHGNGMTTLYAHLSKRLVKEGDKVTQGQKIGLIGSTGNSTGPHLHYEISKNGSRVNPLTYYDSSTYVIDE